MSLAELEELTLEDEDWLEVARHFLLRREVLNGLVLFYSEFEHI